MAKAKQIPLNREGKLVMEWAYPSDYSRARLYSLGGSIVESASWRLDLVVDAVDGARWYFKDEDGYLWLVFASDLKKMLLDDEVHNGRIVGRFVPVNRSGMWGVRRMN